MLCDCPKAMRVWHKLIFDFHNDSNEDGLHWWFKMHATRQYFVLYFSRVALEWHWDVNVLWYWSTTMSQVTFFSLSQEFFIYFFFVHLWYCGWSLSHDIDTPMSIKCYPFFIGNSFIGKRETREMIFIHLFYNNFCGNFLSHTHIIFLLSLSIVLVFVSVHTFLCKNMVVT